MTHRPRLTKKEADSLGLEPKERDSGGNARYTLNNEQFNQLLKLRSQTKLTVKGKSTLYDADENVVMEWVKTEASQEERLKAFKSVLETLKEDIQPTILTPLRNGYFNENLCNQYTFTDYHLGMMAWAEESGEDWDMKIAEKTLIKFFEFAIERSPMAEEAVFAQIGDFIHWDGLDAVTPMNRHVLDADTRFTKLVRVAIRVIRRIIKMLLEKYRKVTLIMAEGNHDQASSVWLREAFSQFYEDEPRLIIDTNPSPYYCKTFGDCCLFYHHGHKRNMNNVDSVFVSKFKEEFGKAKFIYGHLGHLHSEAKKETNLMILERHRTLASKDAYASRGGWNSDRDAKVITYHKHYGEVGRVTINIKMLE